MIKIKINLRTTYVNKLHIYTYIFRIFYICNIHACHINNCIEDEKHVLLDCPVYEYLRQYLFNHDVCIIIILCTCLMLINLYFYLLMRICVTKSAMRFE
jgi:hypothetical protein